VLGFSTDPNAATDGAAITPLFTKEAFDIPKIEAGGTSPELPVAFTVKPAVAASLSAGTGYHFVATLKPRIKNEETASSGETANTFEFLGTPNSAYRSAFAKVGRGGYFQLLKDTISGSFVINSPSYSTTPNVDPTTTDYSQFVAAFEGNRLSPYLDSGNDNIPTIGIGINLKTLSPTSTLGAALVADVKETTPAWRGYSPAKVIAKLIAEAKPATARVQAPAALDSNQSTGLFTIAETTALHTAMASVPNWNDLNPYVQNVLTDLAFNAGSVFSGVASAVASLPPNLALAAFQLANSKRFATQHLITRTEADLQELFGNDAAGATVALIIGS
jgi:GH24 family phage-related lysozyme (muramidase)